MQSAGTKLNSDRCSGHDRHRETPPQLQPPAPTQHSSPGHWGEGIRYHMPGACPARHAGRGPGGRSRRWPDRQSRRTAERAPRAPDRGEISGSPAELPGARGPRQREVPLLLGGRASQGCGARPARRPAGTPTSARRPRPLKPQGVARVARSKDARSRKSRPAMTSRRRGRRPLEGGASEPGRERRSTRRQRWAEERAGAVGGHRGALSPKGRRSRGGPLASRSQTEARGRAGSRCPWPPPS